MSLGNPIFRQLVRLIIAGRFENAKDAYRFLLWKFSNNSEKAARFMWESRNAEPFKDVGGEIVTMQTVQDLYELAKRYGTNVTFPKIFAFLLDTRNKIPNDLQKIKREIAPFRDQLVRKFGDRGLSEQELFDSLYETLINVGGEQITMQKAQILFESVRQHDTENVTMPKVLSLIEETERHVPADLDPSRSTTLQNFWKAFRNIPKQVENRLMAQKEPMRVEKLHEELNVALNQMRYIEFLGNRSLLKKEELTPTPEFKGDLLSREKPKGAEPFYTPTPTSPMGQIYSKSANRISNVRSLSVALNYIDSL